MPSSDFRLLDSHFRITVTNPAIGDEVARTMEPLRWDGPSEEPPTPVEVTSDAGFHVLLVEGMERSRAESASGLVVMLLSQLNRMAVEAYSGFAVHAGAVSIGHRVLAFPGASGSGKSTLTAACLLAGASYVSDEALCVEPGTGAVVPYPKPISLHRLGRELLGLDGSAEREVLYTPADLGAEVASGHLELSRVIVMERVAEGLRLTGLAASEGMSALLGYSFNHYKDPERSFRLTAELASRASTWRLEYRSPLEAAAALVAAARVEAQPTSS